MTNDSRNLHTETVATNNSAFVGINRAATLRPGDTVIGPLLASQSLHVVMSLKLRDQEQLQSYLKTPGRKTFTAALFGAQYSPTLAQAEGAAACMTNAGFAGVTNAPIRMLVDGYRGTDTAQAAFGSTFVHAHTEDSRYAFANDTEVRIPASSQSSALDAVGLQTVHVAHTFAKRFNPNAVHSNASGTTVAHKPTDFALIYGAGSQSPATSIPVGVITEGSVTNVQNDLKTFTSDNGLPEVSIQVVGSGSCDTRGNGEWDLDTQDIVGISGGVQKVVLYDAASLSDADLSTDYNAVVSANAVPVINVSLGECETDADTATDDQIFEQAQAQGQTFSVSSGDSGADECGNGGITPSYAASSPYVVAVGGTELYTTGGTSLASPLFVGYWASILQANGSLGFAAPLLYADAAANLTDFHDVTSGNNDGGNSRRRLGLHHRLRQPQCGQRIGEYRKRQRQCRREPGQTHGFK